MTLLFLILVTCFLAYSNGANDNFKGVASLFGSGTTGYRRAIWWATATAFTGSIASMVLAQSLLTKFSGKGIVPDQIVGSESFLLAVALGAGLTVIVATLTGFPVSTTHALTGAIVGAGLVAVGTGVNVWSLGRGFLLPLGLSPILAIALAATLYLALPAAAARDYERIVHLCGRNAADRPYSAAGVDDGPPVRRPVCADHLHRRAS